MNRIVGIDLAKGLGIIGVVAIHSISLRSLDAPYLVGWVAGSGVALLLACMGVVTGLRVASPEESPNHESYLTHLRRRAARLLPAFVLAWLVALVIGLVRGGLVWGPATAVGMLPIPGPGSYFVPLVAQWVLLEPLVLCACRAIKRPPLLFLFFVGGLVVQWLWWRYAGVCDSDLHFWVWGCILAWGGTLLGGVSVGAHLRQWSPGLLTAAVLAALATGLGLFMRVLTTATMRLVWSLSALAGTCSVLAIGARVPPRNSIVRAVAYLGRASWHIFLVNLLYFGAASLLTRSAWRVFLDLLVCTIVGAAWFRLESEVVLRIRRSSR